LFIKLNSESISISLRYKNIYENNFEYKNVFKYYSKNILVANQYISELKFFTELYLSFIP